MGKRIGMKIDFAAKALSTEAQVDGYIAETGSTAPDALLIFSTSVDKVALNFNTPQQVDLGKITVADCQRYLEEGHFAPGSMRPKIEAAIDFLEAGGERVIVTQPHHLEQALYGIFGTHIVP